MSRLVASWLNSMTNAPKYTEQSCVLQYDTIMKVLTNCQRLFRSDRMLRDVFFLNEEKGIERYSLPT